MKKILFPILVLCIVYSSVSFSQTRKMNEFQKEYNALEFKLKTKSDSLNHVATQKINKLTYDFKADVNDLHTKYGANDLKRVLYQKKYEKEMLKTQAKYELEMGKIQGEHQIETAKIQLEFETKKNRLQLKYNIH
ncbi:MAG: hypothetical protein ACJA1B_001458 [Polaribacter sp.]|jgi:uncharacterized protein (DUF342 family)